MTPAAISAVQGGVLTTAIRSESGLPRVSFRGSHLAGCRPATFLSNLRLRDLPPPPRRAKEATLRMAGGDTK